MLIVYYVLGFSSLSILVKGQMIRFIDEAPEVIKDTETVLRNWERLEYVIKNVANDGVKMLLPLLMDNANNLNISSSCMKNAMHLIGGIRKIKTWALRFVDSTAKSLDGLITGTVISFGAYDECLDSVVLNQRSGKQKGKVMFTGKYCLLRIRPYLPPKNNALKYGEVMEVLKGINERDTVLSEATKHNFELYAGAYRMGLCVPSGCSVDDLNQVFGMLGEYAGLHAKVKTCEVKEKPKYTPLMIFVLTFFSFSGFVVLVSSLADIYCSYYERKPQGIALRLLLAFSFISNFQKLIDTSTASTTLSCLNGIRFITMSWVVMEHVFMLGVVTIAGGLLYVKETAENDLAAQVLINPSVAVDTFFFLGGFLVCYLATKHVVLGHHNFNIKVYILHRIFRIFPSLIFVMLYTFIMEITTTGPAARDVFKPYVDACKDNWWATLLFINNFYRPVDACLPHTWYLAVDMQLYIASLIILLPLLRWPKVGKIIAVVCLVASMIGTGVEVYVKNFPPTFLITHLETGYVFTFAEEHYMRPYTHAGVYIIGMMSGYLLAMKPDLKIPKVVRLVGWCCAITASTSIVYGTFEWNRGREATVLEAVFYSTFHKIAWALSIGWMIICCATGYGGIVNYILSWKLWIPLGRLTYLAYLVHLTLVISLTASIRNTFSPTHVVGVWMYFGCLMATYAISFVASMLVESPLLSIQKLLLPQRSETTTKETGKEDNHALNTVTDMKEAGTQKDGNFNASESYKWSENEGFVYKL